MAPIDQVMKTILDDGQVPYCVACGGPVKPDITLFGEQLPDRYWDDIETDTDEADFSLFLEQV